MNTEELLDEKVVAQNGVFQRVRRWWKGIHPEKGKITRGWSGWETVEEVDHLLGLHRVTVSGDAQQKTAGHA